MTTSPLPLLVPDDTLYSTLQPILDHLSALVPHDAANIMLLTEDNTLRVVASRGYEAFGQADFLASLSIPLGGLPAWQAKLARRKAYVVPDTQTYADWLPIPETSWIRSFIGLPILVEDRVLGIINLDSAQPQAFSEDSLQYLMPFAQQAALTIHNVQLFQAERRQRQFAEALAEITTVLSSSLQLDDVLENILHQVARLIPHDAANIMRVEGDQARVVAQRGYAGLGVDVGDLVMQYTIHDSPSLHQAFTAQDVAILNDVHSEPGWLQFEKLAWLRATIVAPIITQAVVSGFLVLDSATPDAFASYHVEQLRAISSAASLALRNAEHYTAEHRQRRLAEALSTIDESLIETRDVAGVLERVLELLAELVPYDVADIMRVQDGIGYTVAHRGYAERGLAEWIENLRLNANDHGLVPIAMQADGPYYVPDVRKQPAWATFSETAWIRSHMFVPIRFEANWVGIIQLNHRQPHAYTEEDVQTLKPFAERVALLLRNAQLFQAEREQRQLAEALQNSITALNRTLSLDDLFERMIDELDAILPPYGHLVIALYKAPHELYVQAHRQQDMTLPPVAGIDGTPLRLADYPSTRTMIEGRQPLLIRDMRTMPWFDPAQHPNAWVRSMIGVPMVRDEEIIGTIAVASGQPESFTAAHLRILDAFAEAASAALRNAQLYDELARERAQLSAILDGSGDGIVYLENNRVVYANQAFCDLVGYTYPKVEGMYSYMLFAGADGELPFFSDGPETLAHNIDAFLGKAELRVTPQHGAAFQALGNFARISDPGENTMRVVGVIRDIRQDKKLRDLQTRFLTHAAHELRQPITNIVTRLYLMQRSPDDVDYHLQVLQRAVDRLTTLTEHMSTVAEFELGVVQPVLYKVSLDEVLRPVFEEQSAVAAGHDVNIQVSGLDELPPTYADVTLLPELLRMLLSHLVLYTLPHETIRVLLNIEDAASAEPQLKIDVTGGTPPIAEIERVFEPFYNPSEGDSIHTGLELTIAKRIVDLHGGAFNITPLTAEHARFQVSLPAHPPRVP